MQLYSKKVKKHKLHAIKINKVFISINVCLISNLANTKASITKISGKKVHHTIFIHMYGHLWIHVKVNLKYWHVEWMVPSNWACRHSWVKHLVVKGYFELFLEPPLVSGLKRKLSMKEIELFASFLFFCFPHLIQLAFKAHGFFWRQYILWAHGTLF